MGQMAFDDEDGTLSMLRDSVAGFGERFPGPRSLRARRAGGADLDREVWSAMAEAGWLGLLVPSDDGGAGLTLREQAVLSEALGRALVTEPLAQLAVFAGTLLRAAPASGERTRLMAGIADGSLLVTSAWQGADGEPVLHEQPHGIPELIVAYGFDLIAVGTVLVAPLDITRIV